MDDPRQIEMGGGRDLAAILGLVLDDNGSPVTVEPATWLVCFVPGLRPEWWHRFVKGPRKHVFAIRPDSHGAWTLFEPWWSRLFAASITAEQARGFLAWAAAGDVLLVRESVPGSGSQICGWMTCAILVSFLLGRRYRAWTPDGLYRHLVREKGVHPIDVTSLLAPVALPGPASSKRSSDRRRHTQRVV